MPAKCPQCGTPLPGGALAGLCPACLLAAGAAPDTVSEPRQPAFTPPPVAELAAKFPQLEIIELIGKGGMGAVYKARQRELDRIVALKILPPGIGHDAAFAERFTREARAMARLNHPGIVTLYEFGKADGLYFFLMEYVDGVNLRQLLQVGRISPREALAIVPQICDALQFAHDQGIVHRDIKPENLLMDRRGRVKVADFGLAKLIGSNAGDEALIGAAAILPGAGALTESGKVMGTPQYMSPEQKEHPELVDHRADIYALGVVFYQMLTGELPGKKVEPPSTKVQIDVRLDDVVLRALEKKPELRYQQASVLKTQVETIATDSTKPAVAVPPPTLASANLQNRLGLAANIVSAVALFLLGWGASSLGIFFNYLFVLILLLVPVRLIAIIWNACFSSLELGFFRRPLVPELKKHRWQLLNKWLFWALAVLTVEVCLVPPQFNAAAYHLVQGLLLVGGGLLVLFELFPAKRIRIATNIVFAIGSIFMLVGLACIYWPVPVSQGVVLSAPFRGEWLVLHGGRSSLINIHRPYANQRNALDLERLVDGQEKTGAGNALEDYPSWGQPLYAPADGKVTEIENDLPDNPMHQSDVEHAAGNHVVIDIGHGKYVMLAHFQKGSLTVAVGDVLRLGQPIAKCGHSGNTSQPHLHLQVQDQPKFSYGEINTFPIFFTNITCLHGNHQRTDSPFYVRRNDRILVPGGEATAAPTNSNVTEIRAASLNFDTQTKLLTLTGNPLVMTVVSNSPGNPSLKVERTIRLSSTGPLVLGAAPRVVAPASAHDFGPVKEYFLEDNYQWLDLDTGQMLTEPPEIRGSMSDDYFTWLDESGADIYAVMRDDNYSAAGFQAGFHGLQSQETLLLPTPNTDWTAMSAGEVVETVGPIQINLERFTFATNPTNGPPGTYLFRTREGSMGILQITRFTSAPRGAELRYKLVKPEPQPAASNLREMKITLARATNQFLGTTTDTRRVTFWSDTLLEPDQKLSSLIKGPAGKLENAGGYRFTMVRDGHAGTSTSFDWTFREEEGFGAAEADQATAQIRKRCGLRGVRLILAKPLEVFSVTNQSGETWTGYIEADRVACALASDVPVKAHVEIARAFGGYSLSLKYSVQVPDGYRLQATTLKGEGSTMQYNATEYHSDWSQPYQPFRPGQARPAGQPPDFPWVIPTVPPVTNNSGPAWPPHYGGPQFEPFDVVLGVPKLVLCITNEPGDVFQGFLELVGPANSTSPASAFGAAERMGSLADLVLAEQPPVVVETYPVSGAQDVLPGETEVRVRFSKAMMDGTWSWSMAWNDSTPEAAGEVHYLNDLRTCVFKVKLEPDRTYGWWLNSDEFKNFKDRAGRAAIPYLFSFHTKSN